MEHANNESGKRIFIPAIGSLGDVKPYLTLAKELKKQGYIVWLGVHKRFEQQIKDNGMNISLSFSQIPLIMYSRH